MKTDSNTNFYKYKNGKMYSTCIECFNKKVRCEFCNKELNKSHLKSHIKKQHMRELSQVLLQGHAQGFTQLHAQSYPQSFAQGLAELPAELPTELRQGQHINIKDSIKSIPKCLDQDPDQGPDQDPKHYSTLIVGPSFCGKTHLLLNKLQLIRLSDSEKQIHIITRSPEQYAGLRGASHNDLGLIVEEDLGDKSIQDFQNCVVFDDMLDSNQKLLDPFFTRGRHNLCDVYYLSQSYFEVPKRTIRNNSNIIILFQQTLKEVEHIHRDIAGFDMSYDEFKELCREAWKEKYNYLLINRLEDKNGTKYQVCNESNPNYKVFNPQTEPF